MRKEMIKEMNILKIEQELDCILLTGHNKKVSNFLAV
jgi:hypothetical protein